MRIDRSADARKSPQAWTEKLSHPPRQSGGSAKWWILGGAVVSLALLGALTLMMLVVVQQREETGRQQMAAQDSRYDGDFRSGTQVPYYVPPSDGAGTPSWTPPSDYQLNPPNRRPGVNDLVDGTSNTVLLGERRLTPRQFLDEELRRQELRDWTPAQGWGHVRGRFVVGGELPKLPPPKLPADGADADFIRQCDVRNESLRAGRAGELANVVIYLRTRPPQVHNDFQATANAEITARLENCRLQPRVSLVRKQQSLRIVNGDPLAHQPRVFTAGAEAPQPLEKGGARAERLMEAGAKPSLIECERRPFVRGWVLVRDNPYMGVTSAEGTFEIKHLPAGLALEFQVWHELPGFVGAPLPGWNDGAFRCRIEANQSHDLGTIELPAALFDRKTRRAAVSLPGS